MTKSELFKRAWEIAREAKNNFGGSVKSYFAEALKQAWEESRMEKRTETTTTAGAKAVIISKRDNAGFQTTKIIINDNIEIDQCYWNRDANMVYGRLNFESVSIGIDKGIWESAIVETKIKSKSLAVDYCPDCGSPIYKYEKCPNRCEG